MRSGWSTVLSFLTFPVFKVEAGSNMSKCTSPSATGRCSTPRGTMYISPGPNVTTPSLNWNFNTSFGYDHKDWLACDFGGYRIVHVMENEISDELRWTHRGTEPIEL